MQKIQMCITTTTNAQRAITLRLRTVRVGQEESGCARPVQVSASLVPKNHFPVGPIGQAIVHAPGIA